MTLRPDALTYQMLLYDAQLKAAVQRGPGEFGHVELLQQQREDAAFERYKAIRADWTPVIRARYPHSRGEVA